MLVIVMSLQFSMCSCVEQKTRFYIRSKCFIYLHLKCEIYLILITIIIINNKGGCVWCGGDTFNNYHFMQAISLFILVKWKW